MHTTQLAPQQKDKIVALPSYIVVFEQHLISATLKNAESPPEASCATDLYR
jgi:hypothetical protein